MDLHDSDSHNKSLEGNSGDSTVLHECMPGVEMFSGKRGRKATDIGCVFVHAGAGYHSVQNDNVHLTACNE